jgi:hypothetical protein
LTYFETVQSKRWLALSVLFAVTALIIWGYVTFGLSSPETAFGQRWVSVELVLFVLPPGLIPGVPVNIPVQFKPITGFSILLFLWWGTLLLALRDRLNMTSPSTRQAIGVIAFLSCMITSYELAWNFSLWSARLSLLGANPAASFNEMVDTIAFQSSYYPVNLVFITKLFASLLFVGIYTIYHLHGLERAKH